MNFLDRLEKKIGRYAIPNTTFFLVALQALTYVLNAVQPPRSTGVLDRLLLIPNRVFHGEVWRLVSFLFLPPSSNPFFAFFALYFLFIMGTALEGYWGAFRYNLYLLIAWLATIGLACLTPAVPATNQFIDGSVFLAFAFLYPEFIIQIFFILPVRIKWIALITWIFYAGTIILGSWSDKLQVLAAILNFMLFFGQRVFLRARYGMKHMSEQAAELAEKNKPFHVCAVCGITDKMDRTMEFRYCPDCAGSPGYCINHINNHPHRVASLEGR